MIYINSLEAQLPLFQALSSEIRIEIMKLLLANQGLNIKQLSQSLNLPISTVSPHINKLKDCGLIRLEDVPASHGTQKLCFPNMEQIYIDLNAINNRIPIYQAEIPVGQYSDFDVTPTCGLATVSSFLGKLDEPRVFAHPNRYEAGILWFTTGYIEYILPNFIPRGHLIEQLSLSFEISSEAPRYNNVWPSRIHFFLNQVELGSWTCPGDFGDKRGDLNPKWWYDFLNQYGILKMLTINTSGTYLDGQMLSRVTVRDLNLDAQSILKFRFWVPAGTPQSKGLTLYGRGFGNHDQHLRLSIEYSPKKQED